MFYNVKCMVSWLPLIEATYSQNLTILNMKVEELNNKWKLDKIEIEFKKGYDFKDNPIEKTVIFNFC